MFSGSTRKCSHIRLVGPGKFPQVTVYDSNQCMRKTSRFDMTGNQILRCVMSLVYCSRNASCNVRTSDVGIRGRSSTVSIILASSIIHVITVVGMDAYVAILISIALGSVLTPVCFSILSCTAGNGSCITANGSCTAVNGSCTAGKCLRWVVPGMFGDPVGVYKLLTYVLGCRSI